MFLIFFTFKGRTETIRAATKFTKKACQMIHSKSNQYSISDLIQALLDCSKKHEELTKNGALGQGFDRHLFALKHLSEKKKLTMPELFLDQSYIDANHFILSTSTLYGECFDSGGFGPVVIDGYGLAYGFKKNYLGVLCSAYSSHSNGKQFLHALEQAFDDIFQILEKKT